MTPKPTTSVTQRRCMHDDDFVGAFCEVVLALHEGRWRPFERGKPGKSCVQGNAMSGIDPDAGGYRAIATRALEDCR